MLNTWYQKDLNKLRFSGIKIAAISLGCSKNRIDTEEVLGLLSSRGCILTDDYSSADIIFINTCGFIESAQQESINTLLKTATELRGKTTKIVAAGCLVEVFGSKILKHIPEIDGAIGVHSYEKLPVLLKSLLNGHRIVIKNLPSSEYTTLSSRILTTPAHSANVKIGEGCSNRCHYCLIPDIRGPYRSRSPLEIIEEIKFLLEKGTKEICLVAQDTTAYGSDQPNLPGLTGLIEKILELDHKFWLRIMYTYPSRIDSDLINILASDSRICNYLDIPMQHVNDSVLNRMSRFYNKSNLIKLQFQLRKKNPGINLRTTFMVGYPGETRAQFNELLQYIEKHPFERLGAFTYSKQSGTVAGNSLKQIPDRIKNKRLHELMKLQKEISLGLNKKLIGKKVVILIDKKTGKKDLYYGRTEYQAPEVDGGVFVFSRKKLEAGDWVVARINGASSYNLTAANPVNFAELPDQEVN